MLDSLVRVSRRAGWVADRFATDPEPPRRWHTPRYASSLRRTRSGRTVAPVRPCRDVRGEPGTPVFRGGRPRVECVFEHLAGRAPGAGRTGRAEFRGPTLRAHPFASRRFHVLLNSLFKVLFNFPSRYLSAIGLATVFSLRWSLPPALGCILKQSDSWDARSRRVPRR